MSINLKPLFVEYRLKSGTVGQISKTRFQEEVLRMDRPFYGATLPPYLPHLFLHLNVS